MINKKYKKYFDILEVDSNVSLVEVERAYQHLKNLYLSDSMVTLPIEDEFSNMEREEILKQIEEAYTKLKSLYAEEVLQEQPLISISLPEISEEENKDDPSFNDINFKERRENLGLSVHDLSVSTKIPCKVIINIELEKFHKLPEGGYLRWHIMTLAKVLSIDPKKAANEYMKKYRDWKKKHKK